MADPCEAFFDEFNGLLGFIRSRVEYVTSFREFLKKKPVLVVVESENVATSDAAAAVFVPLPKVSEDFRVFVSALRTGQRDGEIFCHPKIPNVGSVVGHG
jgi:hypothetical protein